ncbi:hypothetical protein [Maridesulfovibrio bastinii]|uniref:hypothetical protein n=1 Tax=Maridesulfovibrio bastinii TaxID=47157 RepID=UPI000404111D|nr:hypothetical protein [Maridesulfovibrio bastinii]
MRNRQLFISALIALLCLTGGCVQKVKVNLLKPGEIKLTGLSKIAILPFNSIESDIPAGKYSAGSRVCNLARKCVADALYKKPYFQLVDLNLEKKISRINQNARLNHRLDGILYGQVWWQVSNEYKNYIPKKMTLTNRQTVKYVCGTDDDGNPIYCRKTLIKKRWDELYKSHYRAVTASLMMSLSVYRIDRNGKVEKVAHVFEIGKKPAVIQNGEYKTSLKIIGFKEQDNRDKTLKTEEGFGFNALASLFNMTSKTEKKSVLEKDVTNNNNSIPASLNMENSIAQAISKRLTSVIQPHMEEFDVVMHGKDKKTQTLFLTGAYQGLTKYLALVITDGNEDLADELLEDLTFEETKKQAVLHKMKADYELSQADVPAAQREPFNAPSDQELTEEAKSELGGMTNEIYNLALAFEGTGDFERALEIYRYGFNEFESSDQDMADGIGRCSLALDMSNRADEGLCDLENEKVKTNLGHGN